MQIGIVGKPNVGKSTLFSALTLAHADRANYPFTTINANKGIGYIRTKCPHTELGIKCSPNNSHCIDGIRYVPIELIDVAGLVPRAHEGRGLGNKFLDDLRQASALIHIIDASGSTDEEGRIVEVGTHDPVADVRFLEEELDYWIKGILERNWRRLSKRCESEGKKIELALEEQLTGLGIDIHNIKEALRHTKIDDLDHPSRWDADSLLELARYIRRFSKPMILALNKADIAPENNIARLKSLEGYIAIETCAEYEYALKRASEKGLIRYIPGANDFEILKPEVLNDAQKKALEQIREYLKKMGDIGTGVERVLEAAVFDLLNMIVVYPVEDEHRWCDKNGNVLPDAYLMPRGSTARDLAYKIHTELGEGFIRAIDARTHRAIGADYELRDGDIIKIVAKT